MEQHTAHDLYAVLWAAADEMRQVMTADVYKDYLLGLVFYKALSDKMLFEAYDLLMNEKPANLDVAQKAYEEYREIYKKIMPSKISSFPYAQEVIDFFLTQGKKLMIVTNKERQLLEYELPFLYKPEFFCNITCGHEAPADKPSGEQIKFALKGYISPEEINPQTVWMIGDSHQDSRAAKAAGVQAIRVNQSIWGEVETKEPDVFYFKNFEELYAALKLAKN